MIYPRLAALAEAAWTDAVKKDEASFNERLKINFALYDKAGIYYFNPFDTSFHPEAIDFMPRITKPAGKNRHHHHNRGTKTGHHHSEQHGHLKQGAAHHIKSKKRHKR